MARCAECRSSIRNPIKDYPSLCRDCGQSRIHETLHTMQVERGRVFVLAGGASRDAGPLPWPVWPSLAFATATVVGMLLWMTRI